MPNTATDESDPVNNTVEELRSLISEAETALANARDGATADIQDLRTRLRGAVAEGKHFVKNVGETLRKQAGRADEAIRENPYQSIGIALGVGLLAGFLLARRSSR